MQTQCQSTIVPLNLSNFVKNALNGNADLGIGTRET